VGIFETLPVLALPLLYLFCSFQFALSTRLFLAFVAPNRADNYNRYNPTGFNPRIKIRNVGK
jgi:hypothetical protein